MVDVEAVEGKTRGGEERIERVLMTAESQDSKEREKMVSPRIWCELFPSSGGILR